MRSKRHPRPAGRAVPKKVKKFVKSEIKRSAWNELAYKDTTQINQKISYDVPYVINLTATADGTSASARQGNKILVNRIEGYLLLNLPSSSIGVPGFVKIVMLRSKDDVQPTWGSLFEATGVNSTDPFGPRNPKNEGKMKIMKTWNIELGNNTSTTYLDKNSRLIRFNKRFKTPLKVQYDGTASGDKAYGQVYLIACSNRLDAATPPEFTHCSYRTWFQS